MVRNRLFEIIVVDSNGVPLPEYPDPDAAKNPDNLTSCYIEVPPPDKDQSFWIKITTIKPLHTVKSNKKGYHFFPTYDGVEDWAPAEISGADINRKQQLSLEIKTFKMKPEIKEKNPKKPMRTDMREWLEITVSELEGRKMIFCPLRWTEINSEITSGIMSKETLGCIDVKIRKIKTEMYNDYSLEYHRRTVGMLCRELGVISVRDHEGTTATHTVGLGNTVDLRVPFRQSHRYDYSDSIEVIRFKYRSREVLQELGIVSAVQPQDESLDGSASIKVPKMEPGVAECSDVKQTGKEVVDSSLRGRNIIKLLSLKRIAAMESEESSGIPSRKKSRGN